MTTNITFAATGATGAITGWGPSTAISGPHAPQLRQYGRYTSDDNGSTVFLKFEYESKLVPYVPQENPELIDKSKYSIISCDSISPSYPLDLITLIFSYLKDTKDFTNASQVCKRFYFASKNEQLWKSLLKQNFPNIKPVNPSIFSIEQQAKIVFQRYFSAFSFLSKTNERLKNDIHQLSIAIENVNDAEIIVNNINDPNVVDINMAQRLGQAFKSYISMSRNSLKDGVQQVSKEKDELLEKCNNQENFESLIRQREQAQIN
jgi:hypothetical protein